MLTLNDHRARWLEHGSDAYAAMIAAIDAAHESVRLESYLIRPQGPAERLRAALLAAAQRGVKVRLLYDAFGSEGLPADFFAELVATGASVRQFSPTRRLRLWLRDHRKLLVCDRRSGIVGGMNIGPEYDGDGVSTGWRDLSLYIEGPVAAELAAGFDAMFDLAPLTPGAIRRFRRAVRHPRPQSGQVQLLQSGLGWPHGRLRRALYRDLRPARHVRCMAAYFVPSTRIRRALGLCVRRGGGVQLLLAGPTDVPFVKYASEHLYRLLMRLGAVIHEYQPQVLHAKLLIIDDVVFIGSCNLDRRSLHINYELLLRLDWPELAAEARTIFGSALTHSRHVDPRTWKHARRWWERWRSEFAYWIVARVDPFLARRRTRAMS